MCDYARKLGSHLHITDLLGKNSMTRFDYLIDAISSLVAAAHLSVLPLASWAL